MVKEKFIQKMHMKKGALHKELHVPKGEKISESKLKKAEHSKNPKLKKRAILAETLKHMHHGKKYDKEDLQEAHKHMKEHGG